MKITDVKVTPVYAEMEAPLRWSMGVETGIERGIWYISAAHTQEHVAQTLEAVEAALIETLEQA